MHAAHIQDLDLNLLRALDALLAERHVTKAAARIGISQPAMSHALARLREVFKDPLFVRTNAGMVPTPRAEAAIAPLGRALEELGRVVAPPSAFDPATAKATFRIGSADYVELVLFPPVLAAMWKAAPGIDVRLMPYAGVGTELLEEDRVDMIVGPTQARNERRGIFVQRLFKERFVCVVRKNHPRVGKRLTLDTFVSLPHALISPRGERGGIVDDALARVGKKRRVAVTLPHFLVAPFVVRETDVVLTLAERIVRAIPHTDLEVFAPPPELGLEGFEMSLLWHERRRADPSHAWLRTLITKVAKTVT